MVFTILAILKLIKHIILGEQKSNKHITTSITVAFNIRFCVMAV